MSTTVIVLVVSAIATIGLSLLFGSLLSKKKLQKSEENADAESQADCKGS